MNVIWATRGHAWGFRFLLRGGLRDPLARYEEAFDGTSGDQTVYRRIGNAVVLRFPDPVGRRDAAGRVIPHDLIVGPPLSGSIRSFEDGRDTVWPLFADAYERLWPHAGAPTPADVRTAFEKCELLNDGQ